MQYEREPARTKPVQLYFAARRFRARPVIDAKQLVADEHKTGGVIANIGRRYVEKYHKKNVCRPVAPPTLGATRSLEEGSTKHEEYHICFWLHESELSESPRQRPKPVRAMLFDIRVEQSSRCRGHHAACAGI